MCIEDYIVHGEQYTLWHDITIWFYCWSHFLQRKLTIQIYCFGIVHSTFCFVHQDKKKPAGALIRPKCIPQVFCVYCYHKPLTNLQCPCTAQKWTLLRCASVSTDKWTCLFGHGSLSKRAMEGAGNFRVWPQSFNFVIFNLSLGSCQSRLILCDH